LAKTLWPPSIFSHRGFLRGRLDGVYRRQRNLPKQRRDCEKYGRLAPRADCRRAEHRSDDHAGVEGGDVHAGRDVGSVGRVTAGKHQDTGLKRWDGAIGRQTQRRRPIMATGW